jgi:nitrite reductase/ring-hydroxylating ferredoxin subunit
MSRQVVSYRGASGGVNVFDAHCPHLGAHIGHGGRVVGDDLICPFHQWKFDSDGRNVEIPYSSRAHVSNRLIRWMVVEAHGVVYVWFDEQGSPPQWSIPDPIESDIDYYPLQPAAVRSWRLPIYPQFIQENGVDFAHFHSIHGSSAGLIGFEVEGPTFRSSVALTFGDRDDRPDHRVQPEAVLEIENSGLGINIARLRGGGGVFMVGITPIDDFDSMFRMTNWIPRREGDVSNELPPVALKQITEQFRQAEQDHEVWANMRYVANPPLVPEEAVGYRAVRSWARSFYPGEPEYEERVGGKICD